MDILCPCTGKQNQPPSITLKESKKTKQSKTPKESSKIKLKLYQISRRMGHLQPMVAETMVNGRCGLQMQFFL